MSSADQAPLRYAFLLLWAVRFALCAAALTPLGSSTGVDAFGAHPRDREAAIESIYGYDVPSAPTTHTANTRRDASAARGRPAISARPSTSLLLRSSATKAGSRVFWSGGDVAKNAAADYARANGAKTLEMTLKGRALEKLPYNKATAKLWDGASWLFARRASGDAHVFLGPNAPRPGSVFERIERPLLERRGNRIVPHSAE